MARSVEIVLEAHGKYLQLGWQGIIRTLWIKGFGKLPAIVTYTGRISHGAVNREGEFLAELANSCFPPGARVGPRLFIDSSAGEQHLISLSVRTKLKTFQNEHCEQNYPFEEAQKEF